MKLTLEIAKIIIDVIVIVMNFKNSFAGGWPHFVKPTTTHSVNGNFWRKGQAASRSLTRTLTPKMPDRREGATFVVLNFGVAFRFSKNRKGQINNKLILFDFIFSMRTPCMSARADTLYVRSCLHVGRVLAYNRTKMTYHEVTKSRWEISNVG